MSGLTRLWNLMSRHRRDSELRHELETHLTLLEEDARRRGLDHDAARQEARRRFGNPVAYREQAVEAGMSTWLDTVWQDVRYAVRTLRRSPGFAASAVLSLALGIGANTAIFSVLDAVLLRSLPVKDADQLLVVGTGGDYSYPVFQRFREENHVFQDLFATAEARMADVDLGNGPERTNVALVSGSYFGVLGLSPVAGRIFTPDDDRVGGSQPVAVASYGYWQRRFGRDRALVGRTVTMNGAPITVVGVAPPEFFGERVGAAPDLWVPLTLQEVIEPGRDILGNSNAAWLQIIGRRRPGLNVASAEAELTRLYRRALFDSFGTTLQSDTRRRIEQATVKLESASTGLSTLRVRFSRPLQVLMTVVALLLLIACANVANLLLARAAARRREIGLRVALGVGRARLVRQLLTESVLLSGMGALLGMLLASWSQGILLRLVSRDGRAVPLAVGLDARVLTFVLVISVATGLLFGLAPAWQSARADLMLSLRSKQATPSRGRFALSPSLVVIQVAISVVLLVGAGLFLRTLSNLGGVDLGFAPDRLLIVDVNPRLVGYHGERYAALCRRLLQQLKSVPGVASVTFSENGVLTDRDSSTSRMRPEGFVAGSQGPPQARFDAVGPDYLRTMGITLLEGRDIDERDQSSASRVVVISEQMARRYFANTTSIGRRMLWGPGNALQNLEIVGVARDVKQHDPRDDMRLRFYVPYFQQARVELDSVRFIVRTAAEPRAMSGLLRQAVHSEDHRLPIISVDTAETLADRTLVQERLVATLSAAFAALALTLTCIGLYGLLAYRVARRTNEIGIRMALGATRRRVLWTVVRLDLVLIVTGVTFGLPLALGASQLGRSLLFGVDPTDGWVLGAATLAMAFIGVLAGAIPGYRASQVQPIVALRHD